MPVVVDNVIGGAEVGMSTAADQAVITGNTVSGGLTGISSTGSESTITANTVADQATVGIESQGNGSTVSTNSVIGSGAGLKLLGDGVVAERNRIGVSAGSETVKGNAGIGVSVLGGDATLTRNIVAGSTGVGVNIDPSAVVELRSNRIWESTDEAIAAPFAPPAPTLAAVIRSGSGDDLRRTLLIQDLPAGDAGKIEVFANSSCDDPEARFVMDITRTKKADETARIIQVKGASNRDHFTVTYTASDGGTSELSDCVSGATYPDDDGDGSVDPLDAILDADDDPTTAVIATDNEQLLLLKVDPYDAEADDGGGQLEAVTVGNDPDPGGHPSGWGLAYGALSFRITNVKPGGHTTLTMAALSGSDTIAGTSYWKYGPQTTGGPAGWYAFDYDETTDTGATLSSGVDIPGIGIRRAFSLRFGDGIRGDSDGGANGTITDPGGPVIYAGDPIEPPTTATTTTAPGTTETTAAPAPTTTAVPSSTGGAANDTLARTGTDPSTPTIIGLCLLAVGIAVLVGRRRTTSHNQA